MILDRLRGKKKEKAPPISRSDFLKIIPVPNPTLKQEKDENNNITLIIEREVKKDEKKEQEKTEKRRPRRSLFPSASPQMRQKKIHLDTVGSIVWELCDGKRTTKEIVDQLCLKYKMLPSEAEISLNSYFNELAKRGLLAFLIPEEVASKLGRKELEEEMEKEAKQ